VFFPFFFILLILVFEKPDCPPPPSATGHRVWNTLCLPSCWHPATAPDGDCGHW
jgi:hypothetical protein